MKKKHLLLKTGVALIIFLVFLSIFLLKLKEYQVHRVDLDTTGKSKLVKRTKIIQQNGARPRLSPEGNLILFDRKNEDGFYDLYLSDLEGNMVKSLTEGNTGINQRNNGNGVFHPSGKYLVFISEEEKHPLTFFKWMGDPGLGSFANLYATTPDVGKFWQLTNIPLKKNLLDKTPVIATVNPHFSSDGTRLVWTERYSEEGGHLPSNQWGKWQIKMAGFLIEKGIPRLENETALLRAEDVCQKCNYVTAMGFLPGDKKLIVAGNLSGQHEYGMDQYIFDLETRQLTNLQNTPEYWEEDASLTSDGQKIIYMTNIIAQKKLDFTNPNWPSQEREREYFLMGLDGKNKERLTYFNDPDAPEYLGRNVIVAASDFSPEGRYLAGTLGVDFGNKKKARIELKIVLIEFENPQR